MKSRCLPAAGIFTNLTKGSGFTAFSIRTARPPSGTFQRSSRRIRDSTALSCNTIRSDSVQEASIPGCHRTLFHLRKRLPVLIMFHETYAPCESMSRLLSCGFGRSLNSFRSAGWAVHSMPPAVAGSLRSAGHPGGMPSFCRRDRTSGAPDLSREAEAEPAWASEPGRSVFGVFGSAHPSRLMDSDFHGGKNLRGSPCP